MSTRRPSPSNPRTLPALIAAAGGIGFVTLSSFADPLPLTLIAASNQQAPGYESGVVFTHFDQPRITLFASQPTLTFWARVAGPGIDATNSAAIFSNRAGSFSPVYSTGAVAPWYTATTFNALAQLTTNA